MNKLKFEIPNFTGGLNEKLPPHKIKNNEVIDCADVLFDDISGAVTNRKKEKIWKSGSFIYNNIYNCDVMPDLATPAWTPVSTPAGYTTIETDSDAYNNKALRILSYNASDTIWKQNYNMSGYGYKGYIEFRAKKFGGTADAQGVFRFYTSSNRESSIRFYNNEIKVEYDDITTLTSLVITDYNIFRIKLNDDKFSLWVNGNLILSDAIMGSGGGHDYMSIETISSAGNNYTLYFDYINWTQGETLPSIEYLYNFTDNQNIEHLLASDGENIYVTKDGILWETIKTNIKGFNNICFETFNGKCWITTGYDTIFTYDGENIVDLDFLQNYKSKYIIGYKNRVFLISQTGDSTLVRWSGVSDDDGNIVIADEEKAWTGENIYNYMYIGRENGQSITGAIKFEDRIVIFKESSLWEIVGETNFISRLVHPTIGTYMETTIQVKQGAVIFANKDYIYAYTGTELIPISDKVEKTYLDFQQIKIKYRVWETTTQEQFVKGETQTNINIYGIPGQLSKPVNITEQKTQFDLGTIPDELEYNNYQYLNPETLLGNNSLTLKRTDYTFINPDGGTVDNLWTTNFYQRIKADNTGMVWQVEIPFVKVGSPGTGPVDVVIATDNGGIIGSGIGISDSKNLVDGLNTFNFSTPVKLTEGNYYWIGMINIPSSGASNHWELYRHTFTSATNEYLYTSSGGYETTKCINIEADAIWIPEEGTFTSRIIDTYCTTPKIDYINFPLNSFKIPTNTKITVTIKVSQNSDMSSPVEQQFEITSADTTPKQVNYTLLANYRYTQYTFKFERLTDNIIRPELNTIEYVFEQTALYESDKFDTVENNSWNKFIANYDSNSQTINFFVRTASTESGLSSATWQSINNGDTIPGSALRWIQFKIEISVTNDTLTPYVYDISINWLSGSNIPYKMVSVIWKNRYWLYGTPSGQTNRPNKSIIFDRKAKWTKWAIESSGKEPITFVVYKDKLYSARADGNLYEEDYEYGLKSAYIITKYYDMNLKDINKTFRWIYFTAKNTATDIYFQYEINPSEPFSPSAAIVYNFNQSSHIQTIKKSFPGLTQGEVIGFKISQATDNAYMEFYNLSLYLLKRKLR